MTRRRGPNRSASGASTTPVPKNASSVTPKTSAVGPRPTPKSSTIASKNAPNVYTVPNATPAPTAPAITTAQPRVESTCEEATTTPAWRAGGCRPPSGLDGDRDRRSSGDRHPLRKDGAERTVCETRPVVAATLPSGMVTFLFTDIEGSTVQWERQPRLMPHALERHDELLGTVLARHGGHVFSRAGDAFAAAFVDPADAARAA